MKKLISLCIVFLGITVQAQDVKWFRAYELAINIDNEWSNWETVDIPVKIDLSNDKITIYSEEVQIYRIIKQINTPKDPSGTQLAFSMIDQDGDRGMFRFRIQNNGTKQMYIDFTDVGWVYNVK